MSADRSQKNFDATPARKQKAKREGNIARSSEVAGIAAFACAAGATFCVIVPIGASAAGGLAALAAQPRLTLFPSWLVAVLALSFVPACAAAAGATAASLVQAGGLRVTLPKWQLARLNPVAGFKRMVGAEAVVSALRATLAFTAVTCALIPLMLDFFARATAFTDSAAFGALAIDGARRACWSAVAVGVCFAAADYAFVRRRWLRELKMTFEEIRRDQKETDGDPAARSRRKTLHRTLVRGSLARTKDASFVVVNPTHIAIAIRYAPPDVPVPEILVRAVDEGAHSVKALARQHGIPIVENVALARALYAQGEAGRAIPSATFVAVARVIAALIREGVLT
jgi:flagellar biosynthesis protein FlhB